MSMASYPRMSESGHHAHWEVSETRTFDFGYAEHYQQDQSQSAGDDYFCGGYTGFLGEQ